MDVVIRTEVLFNQFANALGRILLAPIGFLPEVVAAALVALVTGVLMLLGFKYTSHQSAIKTIRDRVSSEFLALSLFKESVATSLRSQLGILKGSAKLMLLSLVPLMIMIVPVTLLLGQLSLWWQYRPLHVGEEAVVCMKLAGDEASAWPNVILQPDPAVELVLGSVRLRSQRAVCWNIRATAAGYHRLKFQVDGDEIDKELAVRDGPMRVSQRRPGWNWSDVLLHPAEAPFEVASPVQSIEIQYPAKTGWVTGQSSWLVCWFIGSTLAAFVFRGVFNVHV